MIFQKVLTEAREVLDHFLSDEAQMQKLEQAGSMLVSCLQKGGKILSCGNGGSMSDAMHFAEEMSGRFREDRKPLAALALSDPAHLSCVANDYGFEQVFSRQVEALGKEGDVLLAISTSGNSANLLEAAKAARQAGMQVLALNGKDGGKLAGMADLEIRVPHKGYSDRIQEVHIKIIHGLIQYIEENL